MLTGVSFRAYPNKEQGLTLSQWMGCAKFIWNAKCAEDNYLIQFARRYLPIGTYPEVDQKYSQYKDHELVPWLFDCPSSILRNTTTNWFKTRQKYMKGICGRPRKKKRGGKGSIHLTNDMFRFEKCSDGNTRLFIGAKRNNIGYLSFKAHRNFKEPKSIYIIKRHGKYWVSFAYEDGFSEEHLKSAEEYLKSLRGCSKEELEEYTIGIDRGVVRPVQAGDKVYDFSEEQKRNLKKNDCSTVKAQKKLARQEKGSNRSKKTKQYIGRTSEHSSNIRKDFSHKTTRKLVDDEKTKVFIIEDLRTSQMTKKSKPKKDEKTGKYLPNNRRAKGKLNKSILGSCWFSIEYCLSYKAYRKGKVVFKVSARFTSQECADCGHTHPNNRKRQDLFVCESCGHSVNADYNAAEVIKKRAINLILDSGTELSKGGVLLDRGRGATYKSRSANALFASGYEASKKKEMAIAV